MDSIDCIGSCVAYGILFGGRRLQTLGSRSPRVGAPWRDPVLTVCRVTNPARSRPSPIWRQQRMCNFYFGLAARAPKLISTRFGPRVGLGNVDVLTAHRQWQRPW